MEVSEQQLAAPVARHDESRLREEPPLPPRRVGRMGSSADGPTLICLGGVHGNEPAGYVGSRRVVESLASSGAALRGEFLALVGNRRALAAGVRFLDDDLNRSWSAERIAELGNGRLPTTVEEMELLELASEIDDAVARAQHGVWLLDLHTTSADGPPFGVLDDTLANRDFAGLFDIPFVVGLEEEVDGTVLSYYVARGVRTFGLESGQHGEIDAIDRAEAAVWIALAGIGLLEPSAVPDFELARKQLRTGTRGLPKVVEVRYRHAVGAEDGFVMNPGFVSFQPIEAGQVLSQDVKGPVTAPQDGRVLMPLYQEQGDDGFFVVRKISRAWMALSGVLRRLRAERFVHWFPGVRRAPSGGDGFVVDRRVARWFALELLHLMGFRRHGVSGQYLLVSRRPNDTAPSAGTSRRAWRRPR